MTEALSVEKPNSGTYNSLEVPNIVSHPLNFWPNWLCTKIGMYRVERGKLGRRVWTWVPYMDGRLVTRSRDAVGFNWEMSTSYQYASQIENWPLRMQFSMNNFLPSPLRWFVHQWSVFPQQSFEFVHGATIAVTHLCGRYSMAGKGSFEETSCGVDRKL